MTRIWRSLDAEQAHAVQKRQRIALGSLRDECPIKHVRLDGYAVPPVLGRPGAIAVVRAKTVERKLWHKTCRNYPMKSDSSIAGLDADVPDGETWYLVYEEGD